MTNLFFELEEFKSADGPTKPESADYLRGHRDGTSAAKAETAEKHAAALANLNNALSDLTFGYEEARQHLSRELSSVMAQVAEAILPTVLKATFSEHLKDFISATFEDNADAPVTIAVSKGTAAALQESDDFTSKRFIFTDHADLMDGQALILNSEDTVLLDLARLQLDLQTALCGLEGPERTSSNG